MPNYEFHCKKCRKVFAELVHGGSATEKVACPQCGGTEHEKVISAASKQVSTGQPLRECTDSRCSESCCDI